MNAMTNPIVFYPAAVIMIVFAFMTIKFHNIFYSLISAIVVFFLAGMFFYVLGSEYNAVIQIAIYGVAVPVILGLAIMFTKREPLKVINAKTTNWLLLVSAIFVLSLVYLLMASCSLNPDCFNFSDNITGAYNKSLWVFGQGLFIKYLWAFELMSLILTIVVVGLTLFKKEGRAK